MGRRRKADHPQAVVPGGDEILTLDGVGEAQKRELVVAAWEAGDLSWKLHRGQLENNMASDAMPSNSIFVEICARRFGKTFAKLVQIEERARRNAGCIQLFAAPTKAAAADIVMPNWRKILADCPPHLRPKWVQSAGVWEWPNKSVLKLRGTDLEVDRLRGAGADNIDVDEAGFHKNLWNTVMDILLPQTDTTGGKMTICTTPPDSLDHDFVKFWNAAKLGGGEEFDNPISYQVRTVYDNPMLSVQRLKRICARANLGMPKERIKDIFESGIKLRVGDASPTWEREYLCRMITDAAKRVTPEFSEEIHVGAMEWRPGYYQPYTFLDLAFVRDYTHALFAYHDFEHAKLVVLDEWRGRRMSSEQIVTALRAKEKEHFAGKSISMLRFGDNSNQQQLFDMATLHKYNVLPTKKDNKEAMVNHLRTLFNANKILIHPRCSFLISQLRDGIWKDKESGKPDFERSEELGHLDGIDALVYGVRNVNFHYNPAPMGLSNPNYFVGAGAPQGSGPAYELRKLMRGVYGR